MSVKVFIKRYVPESKEAPLRPLVKQLRNMAMNQPGYISGETLKRIDRPGATVVISTWKSMEEWREWMLHDERIELQKSIDDLLGKQTEYEIYTFD